MHTRHAVATLLGHCGWPEYRLQGNNTAASVSLLPCQMEYIRFCPLQIGWRCGGESVRALLEDCDLGVYVKMMYH